MISDKQGLISLIAPQACGVSSSLAVCTQSQAAPSFSWRYHVVHGHCVLSMALVGLFVENLVSTACGSVWEAWGTLAGRNESLMGRP